MTKAILVAAIVLVLPGGALAATSQERPLPWSGGQSVVSEFEATLKAMYQEWLGQPFDVYCNGDTDWHALGVQGSFDPRNVWGYVPGLFNRSSGAFRPHGYVHLSSQACWFADQFWAQGDKRTIKTCETGTRTEYVDEYRTRTVRILTTKRVKLPGKWIRVSGQWIKVVGKRVRLGGRLLVPEFRYKDAVQGVLLVRVRQARINGRWLTIRDRFHVKRIWVKTQREVLVQVPKQVPEFGTCPEYGSYLKALQTIAHEAFHLGGWADEAVAECYGLQNLAWVATKLGADGAFAKEIADDYWQEYQIKRPGTPYHSSQCGDRGLLDLRPDNTVWPSGY